MEQDTQALRAWLDANGHAGVPIDINEFGAPVGVSNWGQQVAQYTQWALCTPALRVEDVNPYWWGGIPIADADPWSSMVNSEFSETALGAAYLSEVTALTTLGCPASPPAAPAAGTKPPHPTKTKLHRKRKSVKAARHDKHAPRRPRKAATRGKKRHPAHTHKHR
jgi:hypothetical protein